MRGDVESLGADCIEKEIRPEHLETLARLLAAAAPATDGAGPSQFRRYGSARRLYNFTIDDVDALEAAQEAASR